MCSRLNIFIWSFCFWVVLLPSFLSAAQDNLLSHEELQKEKRYETLAAALKEPELVLILAIDSSLVPAKLPAEIGKLRRLQRLIL